MKRGSVALGDLKPNPFKKLICEGKLDDFKVRELAGSINDNGFWDRLVGREKDGETQIAFGHHTVSAGKKALGKDYVTSIQILPLSDADMLRMLAAENATNKTDSVEAQVDVVRVVQIELRKSLDAGEPWCESCADLLSKSDKKSNMGRPIACGSQRCITHFLNTTEVTWTQPRVSELLTIGEKLHPAILATLTS